MRNFLINSTTDWVTNQVQVLSQTNDGIAFMKGDVITVLTNIGSPVSISDLIRCIYLTLTLCIRYSPRTSASPHTRRTTTVFPPRSQCMYSPSMTTIADLASLFSILTCRQYAVGSNGSIEVEYSKGGVPVILVPDTKLDNSGLCGHVQASVVSQKGAQGTVNGDANGALSTTPLAFAAGLVTFAAALLTAAL